jgi:salicylate hydroxylase
MPEDSKVIKIAIIGGGLAGATLANALLTHPHLDINIFESAPEFSERGAAVGISTNGQAALAESADVLADVIDRAGGVVMTSSRLMIVSDEYGFRVSLKEEIPSGTN